MVQTENGMRRRQSGGNTYDPSSIDNQACGRRRYSLMRQRRVQHICSTKKPIAGGMQLCRAQESHGILFSDGVL